MQPCRYNLAELLEPAQYAECEFPFCCLKYSNISHLVLQEYMLLWLFWTIGTHFFNRSFFSTKDKKMIKKTTTNIDCRNQSFPE